MYQTRSSISTAILALFRLRREQGVQTEAESAASYNAVSGVPEHLRRDVGLPPTAEHPPPVSVYLHRLI